MFPYDVTTTMCLFLLEVRITTALGVLYTWLADMSGLVALFPLTYRATFS